jgi:hypothetical protein
MPDLAADFVVRGIGGDPWIDLAIRLGTAVEHGSFMRSHSLCQRSVEHLIVADRQGQTATLIS